jgi:hypothetical protein
VVKNPGDGGVEGGAEAPLLGGEVDEGDAHEPG